jgi:integrase
LSSKKDDIKGVKMASRVERNATIDHALAIISMVEIRQKSLPGYNGKEPSEKTANEYAQIVGNLLKGATNIHDVIAKAKDTTSIRTWYKRRAALIHAHVKFIKKRIRRYESDKDVFDSDNQIKEIKALSTGLETVEASPPIGTRKPAKSKKQDLKYLPLCWRQDIILRMPNYQLPVLTLALTGCRPSELVKGVVWSIKDGKLHTEIRGTKINKHAGQELRGFDCPIEGDFAPKIADFILNAGGSVIAKIDSAINLTTAIREAGKRAFPRLKKSITSISFRHQFAADWKARAHSSEDPESALLDLSIALGHRSDVTKRYYGHEKQAGGGGVGPENVTGSSLVKQAKKKDFSVIGKRIRRTI